MFTALFAGGPQLNSAFGVSGTFYHVGNGTAYATATVRVDESAPAIITTITGELSTRTAMLEVSAADATPLIEDSIVVGSDTWTVKAAPESHGGIWRLQCSHSSRDSVGIQQRR